MKRNMHHKIELPIDFAQQILNCDIEIKLASEPPADIVKKIIQLYSLGLSYYQSIRSYKYLYFQKKMNELFQGLASSTPENPQQNEKKQSPQKQIKPKVQLSEQQKIKIIKIRQQQQRHQNQINEKANVLSTHLQAKNIMEKIQVKELEFSSKLKGQIRNQDKSLQEKLMRRKSKGVLCKSLSLCDYQTKDNSQNNQLDQDQRQSLEALGLGKNIGAKKPIQATFQSIIKQDSEQDEQELRLRKNSINSSFKNIKIKSSSQLHKNT